MATFTFAQLCSPRAAADTNWVKEDTVLETTGNVLKSIPHPGAPSGTFGDVADTDLNLDALFIVGVNGSSSDIGNSIAGKYGRIVLSSDGTYTYTLYTSAENPDAFAAVQQLTEGETLEESFAYTVGDGVFTSDSSLTLTVFGTDDGVLLTGLGLTGGDQVIYENDLPDGTSPDAAGLTRSGTFSFTAPDGLGTLDIGGTLVIDGGLITNLNTPISTPSGIVTITGIDLATGFIYYDYTLSARVQHASGQGTNSAFDNIPVTVTDRDGSTASNALIIKIVDDVPTATCVTASAVLDDEGLPGGVEGGIGDVADALKTISGTLGYEVGADGLKSLELTGPSKIGTESVSSLWSASTNTLTVSSARGPILSVVITDTATGAYTISLLQPIRHTNGGNENDAYFSIGYTLLDGDDDKASGSLKVTVNDDSASAADDGIVATVTECSKKVVIGTTATLLANDSFGADGAAASGAIKFATGSHGGKIAIDADGNILYTNTRLKLSADGTCVETFTYTIKDRDGDISTATFSVVVKDSGVTFDAPPPDALVDEDDLSTGLHDNAPGDDEASATGTIAYTVGKDGFKDIALSADASAITKLDGTPITTAWNPATHTLTGYGADPSDIVFQITLNSITKSGATYVVNLLQPVCHQGTQPGFEDNLSFTVDVTVTDKDYSVGTTSFVVTIDDDIPIATHDFDSVIKGQSLVADGNVITGVGGNDANSTDGNADGIGADGFGNISWVGQLGNVVSGDYGTLTVGIDGRYSYVLNEDNSDVRRLSEGQHLTETFYYKITDAEGDASTAALKIDIQGTGTGTGDGEDGGDDGDGGSATLPRVAFWVPSDPTEQTAANPQYPNGYPLFIPTPIDGPVVVTADTAPLGIFLFDTGSSTYVPLATGTTLFDSTNGIDLLSGGLFYVPTADPSDTPLLTLSYTNVFTDGTITQTVELHEYTGSEVTGLDVENIIFGTAGDTVIKGGAAADIINGRDGTDQIDGGKGDDVLTGGLGQDVIAGGEGADTFVFGSLGDSPTLADADTITDFDENQAGEVIDLSLIDADTSDGADQAFLSVTQSAALVKNSITFYQSGGETIVQADVDGDTSTAELVFKLTGNHVLSGNDFVL